VQRTRELLAAQGVLNHVTVDLELTHDDLVVRADAHDLEQVFVNLMLNAVDAMDGAGHILARTTRLGRDELERGLARRATDPAHVERMREPSPRIARWLAATNARAMAKVVIADAGPGVPAELSERIFEPFVTTKDPGRGTGLGLAIVARVVENCAGTVWVDRAREGGAAFHVLLPLEDV
jgi:signal transduction histidine kinase